MKPAGTILRVNLSSRKVQREPLPENLRLNFIGGRGINSKILYNETGTATKPLSPDNKLIFGASPLSGTTAPAAARFTVTAKSPLTGILGDANAGGFFGPELKLAGYDHIIIEGKSDEPVYLYIEDDKAEIRSAGRLWGKNTWETEELIRDELKDQKIRVASIGQAGENLVRIASVMHEERAAARTGIGAVMGSKKLKAVAVRGRGRVEVAKPEEFKELVKELQRKASETPLAKSISKFGGTSGTIATNRMGILALKNFGQTGGYKDAEKFDPEKIASEFFTASKSCYCCPIHCGKKYEVKDGPYAGEKGNKIEEGCLTPFGPTIENSYLPSILKINNLVNQYGIDSLDCGTTIAVAMDWLEKGVISLKDTDGIRLVWGNYEAVILLIHKIAKREGFGDVLADGIVEAAKKIGRGAEKYISHCKGMVFGGIDIRIPKGMALCLATSTRGCDHLRGSAPTEFGLKRVSEEEAIRRYGTNEVSKLSSYVKAPVAVYYQHLAAITDSLEICRFASESNGGGLKLEDMTKLLCLVTGIEFNPEQMLLAGERIFNLERAYIVREGVTRKDDRLIGKWVEGKVPSGPHKGEFIDSQKWEEMLDDFYARRGWDKNGIPTEKKLKALGLGEIIPDLDKEKNI